MMTKEELIQALTAHLKKLNMPNDTIEAIISERVELPLSKANARVEDLVVYKTLQEQTAEPTETAPEPTPTPETAPTAEPVTADPSHEGSEGNEGQEQKSAYGAIVKSLNLPVSGEGDEQSVTIPVIQFETLITKSRETIEELKEQISALEAKANVVLNSSPDALFNAVLGGLIEPSVVTNAQEPTPQSKTDSTPSADPMIMEMKRLYKENKETATNPSSDPVLAALIEKAAQGAPAENLAGQSSRRKSTFSFS